MASAKHRAEETRIRKILEINSFRLAALDNYLIHEGYVPDSADEQAVKDAVFKFREFYCCSKTPRFPNHHKQLDRLFEPSHAATTNIEIRESESIKYDAVRDLIFMIATRKAQASAVHHEQEGHGAVAVVKSEEA